MNIRSLIIFLLTIFCLKPIVLKGEDISETKYLPATLTASLDTESAHVGDIVTLTLNYNLPKEIKPISGLKIEGLEGLTIVDKKIINEKIKLFILIDKIDAFDIGPFAISFQDKNGETNLVRSEQVTIEVLSNLGDKPAEAQLKPIMGIIPTTSLWLRHLPWLLCLILLVLVITGLILWRKKRQLKINEMMNQKPPNVIALEEIEKLRADKLFENGHYKEFYFRFSEILRRYLERLRGFPAVEFTTEEISFQLKDEVDRNIIPLLREADLVKFADTIPTSARKDEDIRIALKFIQETSPTPSVVQHFE